MNTVVAETNLIKNGGFETGDLTDWTTNQMPPLIRQSLTDNTYSVAFFFTNRYILQEIDITDVSGIGYDLKIAALGPYPQTFDVYIDQILVDSYENVTFNWQHKKIDTADYSGMHKLIFSSNGKKDTTMNVYISNITAYRDLMPEENDQIIKQSPVMSVIIAPFIAAVLLFLFRKHIM